MQKLNDETRNAATLAERDRLAGEIHDSLQQGLSGLRGRAAKTGGELRMESSPSGGTTIEIVVPLRDESKDPGDAAAIPA